MMTVKQGRIVGRVISIGQAIAAPGLMIAGVALKKPKLIKAGAAWCALVTVDSARLAWKMYEIQVEANGLDDDDEIYFTV